MNPVEQLGSNVTPDLAGLPPDGRAPSALSERVRSLRLSDEASQGPGTARLAWTLCILLAASTGTLGWLYATQPPPEVAAEEDESPKAAKGSETPAALDTVKSSGNIALDSKGYVIPRRQILVSPKVSGMLVKSIILEGKRVKKGDVLAELEDTDYRADLARAEATLEAAKQRLVELERGFRKDEIAQARAELAESEAQLKQLESTFRRSAELVESKVVAQDSFEETEARYRAMQRRVERLRSALRLMEEGPRIEKKLAAQADVRQADAELTKAKWRLENCTIRAPISGTILKKNAEEGNVVNPIAFNGSFSLCDLADLSDLEVELQVQERDISRVFLDQKCTIRAEAFPDRLYQGYVSRIMPIADRGKGAISVRVKVNVPADEEGVYLKPEMGAIVSLLNDKPARPGDAGPKKPPPSDSLTDSRKAG